MDTNRKPWFTFKRVLVLIAIILAGTWLVLKVIVPNLSGGDQKSPSTSGSTAGSSENGGISAGSIGGIFSIAVRLSEGQAQLQTPVPLPVVTGEPLTLDEITAIFDRLPALPATPEEQVAFNYPVELLPPPRPGVTIEEVFPPSEAGPTPPAVETKPLEVLRYAPEGEIPIAPFVSVTFSQPMVPLGTISDLAAESVPVKIEPALPGTWRWIGTKTLTFEYDSNLIDRLPKATSYTVTVPAGTKSVSGGELAASVSWTFSTPAPTLVSSYPANIPQPLEPLIFAAFDQRIDPAAVLATIQLYAGNEKFDLALATQAEIEGDEEIKQQVEAAQEGRWLVFKAVKPFPAASTVTVTIGPGTPSAEGPLVTTGAQTFSFSTYAPLMILDHGCQWSQGECAPLTPFYVRFNNPLDTAAFAESMIKVSPEIPGLSINIYYDTLMISGETKGQTTYTVTLSGTIKDIFGQTLGKDTPLTFKVGKAEAHLYRTEQMFYTLDPALKKPVFSVYAINYQQLDVKIYAVQPEDWAAYSQYLRDWQRIDVDARMPGELVFDQRIDLDLPDDELTEIPIELAPYLKSGYGHLALIVAPPKQNFETDQQKWDRYSQTINAWVQVTQIGVDAYTDYSDMLVWTTDLKTGAPLEGITIQPGSGGQSYLTGQDGTVRFAIPSGAEYLVASKGQDRAMLPRAPYFWQEYGWQATHPSDTLSWFVFDDRQMYRPGEEVHVKGWLRNIGGRQDGDVGLAGSGIDTVTYQLMDPQGNALTSGQAEVNALGGFDFVITIPQTVNLGTAYFNLTAQGSLGFQNGNTFTHYFQIQEFRRPEFEVKARNETSGPYFAGGSSLLAVEASYYAGGPLPNADVTWEVKTTPGQYSPPNWPDFIFGEWRPWWWDYRYYGSTWPYQEDTKTQTFTGKTDAAGTHYLKLDFDAQGDPENQPQPMSVSAQAAVMDVNRQTWASTTTLLVHPADLYIGLRSERYFVEKGTPIDVDFIVTDLDGNAKAGQEVVITAARLEWKLKDGEWVEQEVDVQQCTVETRTEPDTCSFKTPVGGTYRITGTVTDDLGRKNQTRFTRWVSGGQQPPARNVQQEEASLIPDKESYQPGDTAEILVQSPFSPAEGLLTVSRSGFLYTQRFTLEGGSTTLKIPIEEAYIPNLHVQVDLVGSAPRVGDDGKALKNVPARPAFATGQLSLSIPPLQRTLSLEVVPEDPKLEPGGETFLNVLLKDAEGKPVSDAELAVVVVDEAILALTDYQMSNPLDIFYAGRSSGIDSVYGRSSLILANPLDLFAGGGQLLGGAGAPMPTQAAMMEYPAAAPEMGARDSSAQAQQPGIAVRSDFNPLAVFSPSVRTDSSGEARVAVRVPDNLTRYRVMVVAVDESGRRFGTGESSITARLPLMVRPSAPRFLNFGDSFELPVVLQNQTDDPLTVEVVARATNLELAVSGLRVTVPANDRIEVRFPTATKSAGTARVQIAAVSGAYADAAVVEMPVYTPATTEAFATYGVIDQGAIAQPVLYPSGVFPQYGGLEINTSSTALSALTDAVLYLIACPYEGAEQWSSRIMAIASLRDVLTAFDADGLPSAQEMEASVERDIKNLQSIQNPDGGFSYWRRDLPSSPFVTIHAAHALVRAQQKGYAVPQEMFSGVMNYLREIESHYPYWYSLDTRRTLSAYALYVRNLSGDRDAQKAQRLLSEAGIDALRMEAIGLLWPVIDNETQLEEIRRYVTNHVVETAGAANFTTAYDDQTYLLLSSDRRTDAILLDALMEDDPESDLIPKVVNGLLAHRVKGRWESTQENAFVLLALDRYFNTYEAQTPDFAARLWLGDTYAGSSEFRGRSTEIHETFIPMSDVLTKTAAGGGVEDIIISKEGAGRLYYRLGLRYAPTDLNLKPLDMGFVVLRRYEAVDNPEDVSQDADGTWHIKAGARVRVHLTMVADNRRYHVALVDPLPAGLEIINPALAVSQNVPQDDPSTLSYGWWWGTWYEHQNLRDDRAEAFTTLLWDGVYEYTYYARATTPGTFIVPPSKAEERYSPEVFGRSGSDRVIVE